MIFVTFKNLNCRKNRTKIQYNSRNPESPLFFWLRLWLLILHKLLMSWRPPASEYTPRCSYAEGQLKRLLFCLLLTASELPSDRAHSFIHITAQQSNNKLIDHRLN